MVWRCLEGSWRPKLCWIFCVQVTTDRAFSALKIAVGPTACDAQLVNVVYAGNKSCSAMIHSMIRSMTTQYDSCVMSELQCTQDIENYTQLTRTTNKLRTLLSKNCEVQISFKTSKQERNNKIYSIHLYILTCVFLFVSTYLVFRRFLLFYVYFLFCSFWFDFLCFVFSRPCFQVFFVQ